MDITTTIFILGLDTKEILHDITLEYMDFDGLVTEHSFTYPEQHYSNEASVLIEDDFFVGDVVEIFLRPDEVPLLDLLTVPLNTQTWIKMHYG